MPVALASEIWSEVKRYISSVDRAEAAETVVNIMIDNDIDVEEIKSNFKGDSDIRRALAQFTENLEDDTDDEEDFDEEEY